MQLAEFKDVIYPVGKTTEGLDVWKIPQGYICIPWGISCSLREKTYKAGQVTFIYNVNRKFLSKTTTKSDRTYDIYCSLIGRLENERIPLYSNYLYTQKKNVKREIDGIELSQGVYADKTGVSYQVMYCVQRVKHFDVAYSIDDLKRLIAEAASQRLREIKAYNDAHLLTYELAKTLYTENPLEVAVC